MSLNGDEKMAFLKTQTFERLQVSHDCSANVRMKERERDVLFNNALNTFYLHTTNLAQFVQSVEKIKNCAAT